MAEKKVHAKKFDALNWALAFVFFVISYAFLYGIGSLNQQIGSFVENIPVLQLIFPWPQVYDIPPNPIWQVSMLNLLMPIIGFWIVFFGIEWIEEFFQTKHAKTIVFPIIFTAFCLFAFFIALYWTVTETAVLNNVPLSQIIPDFWTYYWSELRNFAFYLFLLSGLFGWVSRIAVEKIEI